MLCSSVTVIAKSDFRLDYHFVYCLISGHRNFFS